MRVKIQEEYDFQDYAHLQNPFNCSLKLKELESKMLEFKKIDDTNINVTEITKSSYFFTGNQTVRFSVYAEAIKI